MIDRLVQVFAERELTRSEPGACCLPSVRVHGSGAMSPTVDAIHPEVVSRAQRYTVDDYIENLLTHSRLLRVVEGGHERVSAARAWLRSELMPFFPGGEQEFTHEHRIHVLRRS